MAEDPQQETINLLNYRLNAVTVERDRYKQQRDRMAEALEQLMPYAVNPDNQHELMVWQYAKDQLAAVKGGADE